MDIMAAAEAKNSFGRFLETVQHEPVAMKKNNREIASMFSMNDTHSLAGVFLAEPLKEDVKAGQVSVFEAMMQQHQPQQTPQGQPTSYCGRSWGGLLAKATSFRSGNEL